jgi:hypothetical protein
MEILVAFESHHYYHRQFDLHLHQNLELLQEFLQPEVQNLVRLELKVAWVAANHLNQGTRY